MSDSWSARKLDAGLDGVYLMSSVLMTSTMKSDPGTPLSLSTSSLGVPVSAAATAADGRSADGRGAGAPVGCVTSPVAAPAACGATALAAPASATPVRNLRRSTSGRAPLGVYLRPIR